MTIDEAIEEEKIMVRGATYGNYSREIKYHTQIVEWLEELKELKYRNIILKGKYPRWKEYWDGYLKGKQVGYNNAIDDFVEKIQWEYLNGCGIKQSEIEFLVSVLSQVAEQLKGSISSENTNK